MLLHPAEPVADNALRALEERHGQPESGRWPELHRPVQRGLESGLPAASQEPEQWAAAESDSFAFGLIPKRFV